MGGQPAVSVTMTTEDALHGLACGVGADGGEGVRGSGDACTWGPRRDGGSFWGGGWHGRWLQEAFGVLREGFNFLQNLKIYMKTYSLKFKLTH